MNQRQQRQTRAARRRRTRHQRTILAAMVMVVAIVALSVVLNTSANESGEPPLPTETVLAVPPKTDTQPYITEMIPLTQQTEPPPAESTEPIPSEPITFTSDEIPLSYELQKIMWAECDRWGCPYALALAVAEVESQFNMDAVGAVGEVGIMQLNPGPGGAYHEELEITTGLDPNTPEGNISGGVYLLGSFMTAYDDITKTAMAYNMGQSGAIKAWAAGVTTSVHAEKVLAAMERWEAVLADLVGSDA